MNLKIRGVEFVADFIVLDSKGIDVILEMYYLSKHKKPIDCIKKTVKPTTPNTKELSISHIGYSYC
jgi:hypothetical protein